MKPYETIQELLEDYKIHGPYVIGINNHIYELITSIKSQSIYGTNPHPVTFRVELGGHSNNTLSNEELLIFYTWQDGSPCGKPVEV